MGVLNYINIANSPYFIDLEKANTEEMPLQEVKYGVDTTAGPIQIFLPPTLQFPESNVKLYFTDYKGNASVNNITLMVNPGDIINGLLLATISANYGWSKLEIGTPGIWNNTTFNGGSSSSGITTLKFMTTNTQVYTIPQNFIIDAVMLDVGNVPPGNYTYNPMAAAVNNFKFTYPVSAGSWVIIFYHT